MPLSTIRLIIDLTDIGESALSFTATITPTARIANAAGMTVIAETPVTQGSQGGIATFPEIIASDSDGLEPGPGLWAYQVTVTAGGGASWSDTYLLNSADAVGGTLYLSGLTPVVPFTSWQQGSLGAVAAETARAQAAEALLLPIQYPPGAADGNVWTTDADGNGSWQEPGGGEGGGSVDSVTAADGSVVIGGTGDNPTARTGTLDVIAAEHPPAASVPMNGHKHTGLASGSAAGDSVQFGQLGTAAFQAASAFDAAGAAAAAQSGAEAFATSATGTEAARAETAEALALAKAANLSDLASPSTARASLGLGTAAVAALTALLQAANNLSDLGSASTARTNLGLGTAATQSSSAFDAAGAAATAQAGAEGASVPIGSAPDGAVVPKVVTLTASGSTFAINASLGNVFVLPLTATGMNVSSPTSPAGDGQVIRLRLVQDATGGRTIGTWGTEYDWGNISGTPNSAPTLTTAPEGSDTVAFEWDAGKSKWESLGAAFPQGF